MQVRYCIRLTQMRLVANLILVHLLPQADSIIALGSAGRVAVQATFTDLNLPGGYLSRYDLKAHKEGVSATVEGKEESNASLAKAVEKAIPKTADDDTRQLGDRTIYKYYFKTVGTTNTFIFFLLLLLWVAMLKLPGMKHLHTPLSSC